MFVSEKDGNTLAICSPVYHNVGVRASADSLTTWAGWCIEVALLQASTDVFHVAGK
jgi:hypothetical protein